MLNPWNRVTRESRGKTAPLRRVVRESSLDRSRRWTRRAGGGSLGSNGAGADTGGDVDDGGGGGGGGGDGGVGGATYLSPTRDQSLRLDPRRTVDDISRIAVARRDFYCQGLTRGLPP